MEAMTCLACRVARENCHASCCCGEGPYCVEHMKAHDAQMQLDAIGFHSCYFEEDVQAKLIQAVVDGYLVVRIP